MSDTPSPPDAAPAKALEAVERDFVDLWRSMSGLWGVSPTMAEIHGVLFLSGGTLSVDDLIERLGISRSNVSMSMARLVEWGLVRKVHRKGDRREYFEAVGDVWEMFTLVAAQRKRREIDPMLATLRQCAARLSPEELGAASASEEVTGRRRRVEDLVSFLALMDVLSSRFFQMNDGLPQALEMMEPRDEKR